MGTSTMGSDLHSDKQDKLLKLQARKKELEQMLASKNEELYRLCVQEVQLTGVVPPEAPLSPDVPRERLGSLRSADRPADGADEQDGAEPARRSRGAPDRARDGLGHRLSTPSASGAAPRSARPLRRPDTSCSNFFPSPPHERAHDTFSMHPSHTYAALAARLDGAPPVDSARHHYNHPGDARLRETHFSSSHPDITATPARHTPILYQYASHLKAQSQHLAALNHHHQMQMQFKRRADGARRSTLQRTQTYHLTSHSDYSQHLDAMAPHAPAPEPAGARPPVPATLPLRERARPPPHVPLQVATDDCLDPRSPLGHRSGYSPGFDSVSVNRFSPLSPTDVRAKEKQWYETSLDSPALRQSGLKRTPSVGNSQPYEIMMSSGRHSALRSPGGGAVPLESPKNMTVIEQGKCIPYREETKPFEMSDFYKYSTKFRQATAPKPAAAPPPAPGRGPGAAYGAAHAALPLGADSWPDYTN